MKKNKIRANTFRVLLFWRLEPRGWNNFISIRREQTEEGRKFWNKEQEEKGTRPNEFSHEKWVKRLLFIYSIFEKKKKWLLFSHPCMEKKKTVSRRCVSVQERKEIKANGQDKEVHLVGLGVSGRGALHIPPRFLSSFFLTPRCSSVLLCVDGLAYDRRSSVTI